MAKKRLLVVDDDPDILEVMAEYLEEYQVTCSPDSCHAVQILERETFDLVITDVLMPYVSGYDLLKVLKEKHPETPVILSSGADDIDVASESLDRGAVTFIFKPFDRSELLEEVHQILKD